MVSRMRSKVSYEDCQIGIKTSNRATRPKLDCFIVSGAKVLEGVGQYVVIAIGPKSFNGRMAALSGDTKSTPLPPKLVQILIISITLIVVAVPEGLPLAVTLALAFATKRMT